MTPGIDTATSLEAEALEYPEQRGEILLEAARAWSRAGRPERATGLISEVIDAGGEYACYARLQLAELLFGSGRNDEARAALTSLATDPELHDGHCMMVAELLAEREELTESLRWYDRCLARLSAERIAAVAGPDGWLAMDVVSVRGRRDVRRRLGLPPDATDAIVPTAPFEGRGSVPTSAAELLNQLDDGARAPGQLLVLTFRRDQRAEARRVWPDEYDTSDEEYYPAAEGQWREMAERGVASIQVVPILVEELVAFAAQVGGSPTDSALKTRYIDTVPAERMISWPPPRNAPCWCGSGGKYKKCCGRHTPRPLR